MDNNNHGIIYDQGHIYGYYYGYIYQDFDSSDAVTFVQNEKFDIPNVEIVDGSNLDFHRCCKNYSKPLKNVSLRFHRESMDNIAIKQDCKTLPKDIFR